MIMVSEKNIEVALAQTWHEQTARNSLERWLKLCEQENWNEQSVNLDVLAGIFGSSWYFTRYVFAVGESALSIINQEPQGLPDYTNLGRQLAACLIHDDFEARVNQLRILKNGMMLQYLVEYLQSRFSIEQLEYSLTLLAEVTLDMLIQSIRMLPGYEQFPVSVLAMGRMAGYEMTFGSDLDLIFLYDGKDQDLHEQLGKSARMLLRMIAQPASTGSLYEVDMRLRPHGNAGLLVTSYQSFKEYHEGSRDIWERQMMTRCRPVIKYNDSVNIIMETVNDSLYKPYDRQLLCKEIISMRARVQKELGSPKGRYEIKRGFGGIMDIDFISHYYQLGYGHQYRELQVCSTRTALEVMSKCGLIDRETSVNLVAHYNYLKKTEMCLRLFDMKSVDSFKAMDSDNIALSRAMGHGDNLNSFLDEFETVTHSVRRIYEKVMI